MASIALAVSCVEAMTDTAVLHVVVGKSSSYGWTCRCMWCLEH